MNIPHECLLPGEYTALINALRRDVENEKKKAMLIPEWEAYHLQNARISIRIIEALGSRLDADNA